MPIINENFQKLLIKPGRSIAGDEKLLHFTGDSSMIRLVPSKPDKVGFWFFELVATLKSGAPYILHLQLSDAWEKGDR
jgi:hypothetical protein